MGAWPSAGWHEQERELFLGYDADGVRISKTVNGVETKYYTASDRIMRMEKGDEVLEFLYDEAGAVFGVLHNGTPYYYIRNGQSDIVGLVDQNANIIGQYSYDAWGKPLQTTGDAEIVSLNPFRYRGYVYDEETGLYYLLSRYYDPETGRFINADGFVSTGQGVGGTNMYSYCGNNPVVRQDPTGKYNDFTELYEKMHENLFGPRPAEFISASHTDKVQKKLKETVVRNVLGLTTGKTGTRVSASRKWQGGSEDAPIHFFSTKDVEQWWMGSLGIKVNIGDFSITGTIGGSDTSIKFGLKEGSKTKAGALKIDWAEFKLGLEYTQTYKGTWDNGVWKSKEATYEDYWNCSIEGKGLAGLYFMSKGIVGLSDALGGPSPNLVPQLGY